MNEQERIVLEQFINDSSKLTNEQKRTWQNLLNRMMNPAGLNEVLDSFESNNQALTLKLISVLQGQNGLLGLVDDDLKALELNSILQYRQSKLLYDESMQQNVQKVKQGIEDYQKRREESVQQEINSDPEALKNNIQYQKARVSVRAQLQLLLDKYNGLMEKYPNDKTMSQFRKSVEDYIRLGERWGDDIRDENNNHITDLTAFRSEYREKIKSKTQDEQVLLRRMMNLSNTFLEERTNAQLDVDDTDFDEVSAWAAAEEFNQVISPLSNGYLDLNHPYPHELKDENDNVVISEVEPIRIQRIGKNAIKCSRINDKKNLVEIKATSAEKRMLFTHEPSPMDVVQKSLGNCYMLAGLAAVAEKYPEKIKESIIEHTISVKDEFGNVESKNVVTVRFFKKEVDQKNGNLLGYTPVLVTVDKFVPNNYGNTAALWVQMIERAYAASGLHLDPSQTGAPLQGDVDLKRVEAEYNQAGLTKFDKLIIMAENPQAFRVDADNRYVLRNDERPDLIEIEGGLGDRFLEQFLGPEGERVVFSYKSDTAKSREQQVADFIKANQNNVITAGTIRFVYDEYGRDTVRPGVDQNGLLGGHDYSVLGIEERTFYIDNDPTQPVTKEVVILRNPMGVSGRSNSYDEQSDVLRAKEQVNTEGVVEISLKDFCQNFNSLRANKITELVKVGHPSKDTDPVKPFRHDNFTKQTQLSYLKQFRYFANSLYKTDDKLKEQFKPLYDSISNVMMRLLRDNGCSTNRFFADQKNNFAEINKKCDVLLKTNNPEIIKFSEKFIGIKELCCAMQLRYTNPMEYLESKNRDYDKTVNFEVKPQDSIKEKVQKEHINGYVPHQVEVKAQPQDVTFTKADYIRVLKDAYTSLRRTDDDYSELKNSSEYKNMRNGLNSFIKDLEKSDDGTSIEDLFNANKGLNLKIKCRDYLKHCAGKVRNNERRNTRMDEALTTMSLLTAMSKNVTSLSGVRSSMKLAYAEKTMRETMYSLLDSDDKAVVVKGENLRKIMAARKPGVFTSQLSKFFDSPAIGNALAEKNIDEMHNNLKAGSNGLFANIAETVAKGEMNKTQAEKLIK